jgi:hypothetical protein
MEGLMEEDRILIGLILITLLIATVIEIVMEVYVRNQ